MVIVEIKRVEWNESLQCEFEDIVPALVWGPAELHQFLTEYMGDDKLEDRNRGGLTVDRESD